MDEGHHPRLHPTLKAHLGNRSSSLLPDWHSERSFWYALPFLPKQFVDIGAAVRTSSSFEKGEVFIFKCECSPLRHNNLFITVFGRIQGVIAVLQRRKGIRYVLGAGESSP